jgi:hypothetical protein
MHRLKKYLPIVLIALMVQIFAPIGACWAASIAASDPLAGAVICHGNGDPGADQTNPTSHRAHDGCCSLCSVLQTEQQPSCEDRGRDTAPSRFRARGVDRVRAGTICLPRRLACTGARPPFDFLTT